MTLLDYRNTPQQGQEHSPAQTLLSRRTRGILPMMPSLLQPTVVHSGTVQTEIERRRTRAKHYFDRNLGVSMVLFSQDSGYMQNPFLSTSIQPGAMAWWRKCPLQGPTPWLPLMGKYAGIECRFDWLLLRPLIRRSICPSTLVAKQDTQF